MPKNRWMYIGILVVAAAAIIAITKLLLHKVAFEVLYAFGGLGILLIVVGLVTESKAKQKISTPGQEKETDV